MFNTIPIYDGEDPSKCEVWIEKLETTCRTGKRDIRAVAITCAEGPVLEVINSVKAYEECPVLRDELRKCFSENKTPVHAAALLDEFPVQSANQNLRSFLYKYIKLHKMATGIQARDDFDLRQKLHFLKRLRNTRIANKIGSVGQCDLDLGSSHYIYSRHRSAKTVVEKHPDQPDMLDAINTLSIVNHRSLSCLRPPTWWQLELK